MNQTFNQCGSSLGERATGKGYGEEGGMQLTGRTPQVEQVARLMGQEGTQIPGANEGRGPSTDPWCSQQFPNFGGDRMGQMRLWDLQGVGANPSDNLRRDQQQTSWSASPSVAVMPSSAVHVNPVSCAAAASVHGCAGALQPGRFSQSHEVGKAKGTGSQNCNLFTDPLPQDLWEFGNPARAIQIWEVARFKVSRDLAGVPEVMLMVEVFLDFFVEAFQDQEVVEV